MRRVFMCVTAAIVPPTLAAAAPAVIQPDENASKDAFVYQFLPTFNFDSAGFQTLLASGRTSSGHDLRSFIEFDLTGVALAADEVATLNLFVGDTASAGFGVNPSPAAPVTANVSAAQGAWSESALNWNNQPAVGPLVASEAIDGIGHWVSFDVTPQVQSWLASPGTNFGFAVMQDAIVTNGGPVVAVYESSSGVNRPYLQIAVIPEPAAGLVTASALMLAGLRRSRRRRRRVA